MIFLKRILPIVLIFISSSVSAQVKSTKTSVFIDLPPDKLDSLIAENEKSGKLSENQTILFRYTIATLGFSVGTSLVDRQQVQVIGTTLNYEINNEFREFMLRYNRLYFENEGQFSTDIRQYVLGFGLHYNSENLYNRSGAKIIFGAVHRLYPSKELWGAAGGLGLSYIRIFNTNFVSYLSTEFYGLYSLNEPLIEGKISYHFSPHHFTICTFSYKHIEIPRLVSSDSFGFSVGFFLPEFFVMEQK